MAGILIRGMQASDLPEVTRIEHASFTTPWDINAFKYELRHKDSILKVAVFNNRVIGYACIRTMLDITHILNLAVLPEFRRMGIGSMLLREALHELLRMKPETDLITLEVRESNIAAIRLYEKFGFKVLGIRRGYYQKPQEDAVIMAADTENPSFIEKVKKIN